MRNEWTIIIELSRPVSQDESSADLMINGLPEAEEIQHDDDSIVLVCERPPSMDAVDAIDDLDWVAGVGYTEDDDWINEDGRAWVDILAGVFAYHVQDAMSPEEWLDEHDCDPDEWIAVWPDGGVYAEEVDPAVETIPIILPPADRDAGWRTYARACEMAALPDEITSTVADVERSWQSGRKEWGMLGSMRLIGGDQLRFVRQADGYYTIERQSGELWYVASDDRIEPESVACLVGKVGEE